MKPIEEMSDAEVNRELAERRGWTRSVGTLVAGPSAEIGDEHEFWSPPGWPVERLYGVPPFCSDWSLAGPLFEEMGPELAGCFASQSDDGTISWVANSVMARKSYPTPQSAIARARLAMYRKEA